MNIALYFILHSYCACCHSLIALGVLIVCNYACTAADALDGQNTRKACGLYIIVQLWAQMVKLTQIITLTETLPP